MSRRTLAAAAGLAGLVSVALLVAVGTAWAFQRGARDFNVFYGAWALVSQGLGATVYHATPDRFLYAPGFAWLFAPLGFLPRGLVLALWCFAKAAAVGLILRTLARALEPAARRLLVGLEATPAVKHASLAFAAAGILFLARPLLIDFQYGQVNVFILAACVWALFPRFCLPPQGESAGWDGVRWFFLALVAAAKLFPLPLLLVPWLVTEGRPRNRLRAERAGLILGLLLIVLLPFLTEGWQGGVQLLSSWKDSLLSRGLPLETHNQGIPAILHRWLGGQPVHIIALGPVPMHFPSLHLPAEWLSFLDVAWTALVSLFLLTWIATGNSKSPGRWAALTIGLLILPSHLVWKPYLLMGIPAAALAVTLAWGSRRRAIALILSFVAINFTSIDIMGFPVAAWLEAAGVMMFGYILLLAVCAIGERRPAPFMSPSRKYRKFR